MKLVNYSIYLSLLLSIISCNSTSIDMNTPTLSLKENFRKNIGKGKAVRKVIVLVGNNYSDEKYISYKVKQILINKKYTLPDRENLPAVQKEISFCRSHLTRKCQIRLGQLTNADSIFKVEKLSLDSDYVLAAELIDLRSGNTRWSKTSGDGVARAASNDVFGKLLNTALDDWLIKKGYSSSDSSSKRKESSKHILDRKISALMSSFPSR